jgi:hypothetical protein
MWTMKCPFLSSGMKLPPKNGSTIRDATEIEIQAILEFVEQLTLGDATLMASR